MSKGRPRVILRIDEKLLAEVEDAIRSRNERSKDTPWNLSDYIRVALTEKLDKSKRGKGKKGGVIHPSAYGHEGG